MIYYSAYSVISEFIFRNSQRDYMLIWIPSNLYILIHAVSHIVYMSDCVDEDVNSLPVSQYLSGPYKDWDWRIQFNLSFKIKINHVQISENQYMIRFRELHLREYEYLKIHVWETRENFKEIELLKGKSYHSHI